MNQMTINAKVISLFFAQAADSLEAYETGLQIRINCFGKNNLQVRSYF